MLSHQRYLGPVHPRFHQIQRVLRIQRLLCFFVALNQVVCFRLLLSLGTNKFYLDWQILILQVDEETYPKDPEPKIWRRRKAQEDLNAPEVQLWYDFLHNVNSYLLLHLFLWILVSNLCWRQWSLLSDLQRVSELAFDSKKRTRNLFHVPFGSTFVFHLRTYLGSQIQRKEILWVDDASQCGFQSHFVLHDV